MFTSGAKGLKPVSSYRIPGLIGPNYAFHHNGNDWDIMTLSLRYRKPYGSKHKRKKKRRKPS
jgi:hypothetical protein